jgi:mono/diheme cytochrome c family protein
VRIGHVIPGLLLAGLAIAAFIAYGWRSSIPVSEPRAPASFDDALVEKGAALAAIGNCNTCHTAQGGPAYAGGRALQTPFGIIHATNITPDPEHGIGRWSGEAFQRALREGVGRDGRHLYPAFPYDHYTSLTDEDIEALYAFIMTRDPVATDAPANDLRFPFNIRMLIAAWKAFYLRPSAIAAEPAQSAAWNRGAYLVQSAAHCGSCHTPRNLLGAEKKARHLAGGEAEGWHAPALDAASPSPLPWSTETLYQYLRHGRAERHAVPAGPMMEVVRNLATAPEQDVRAIATYIASFTAQDTPERTQRAEQSAARAAGDAAAFGTPSPSAPADAHAQVGRGIYTDACATCHGAGRLTSSGGTALHLALGSALYFPTPRNLMRIVLEGITPADGESGSWMPGFAGALTDDQIVTLVRYLRVDLAKAPEWPDVPAELAKVQREREQSAVMAPR